MATIVLPSVPSTNTWAKEHSGTLSHGDIVVTHDQTAGRGQRGNHWEAEPGRNLTFSLFLRPGRIVPAAQFLISEIVSLAVVKALRRHLAETASETVTVKWPNDIYIGDRKIAGILIEHAISGMSISHTVAGIGLNVNQTRFISDAPNPVSMAMIAGTEFDLPAIMHEIADEITRHTDAPDKTAIHEAYLSSLWRKDGCPHEFSMPDGARFMAEINDVSETGMLRLNTPGGIREFAFKEVAFILQPQS